MEYKRYLQWLNERLEEENPKLVKMVIAAIDEAYEKNKDILYKTFPIKDINVHLFAFRGTSSFEHIKELTHFSTKKWEEHEVYSGFIDHFEKIKPTLLTTFEKIKEDEKDQTKLLFVFAGHSLGATSAVLSWLSLGKQGKLFLLGMPKMADESLYKKIFGTTNVKQNVHFVELTHGSHSDPITRVPVFMKNIISSKTLKEQFKDFIDFLFSDEDSVTHFKLHKFGNYKKTINNFLQQKEK